MEQIQTPDEDPAGVQTPADVQSENPVKNPLDEKHDDMDVLNGCPRTLKIGGIDVTQKAFKNHEFTNLATIILYMGFGTCQSEEDVDQITLDDIYVNCAMNTVFYGSLIGVQSFEEYLYRLMQFEDKAGAPVFPEITQPEFKQFLGIVLEQNNLIKAARKNAKKNLPVFRQTTQLLLQQDSAKA
jgi:hypothetical protein